MRDRLHLEAMDNETRKAEIFARFLLMREVLPPEQIAEAMRQFHDGAGTQSFGAVLVQRGMVTPFRIRELVVELRGVDQRTLPPLPQSDGPRLAPAVPVSNRDGPPPQVQAPRLRPPPPAGKLKPLRPARAPAPAPPPAPPARPAASSPASASLVSSLSTLLEAAERKGASDVHLHPGVPVALRVEGRLGIVSQTVEQPEQERILLEVLDDTQRDTLLNDGDLDFSYVTPGGLRTRANYYRTSNGIDGTFRLLRREPQSLEELGLPAVIEKLVSHHQGLVLVTGPAGSGKSTTLASLVDLLNSRSPGHILSLEDPIEIVHPIKRALVNQRQINRDTESFGRALRGALREDPDIIVIGELRDQETISLAITAAETGHLVIGSMQTNSAARTVARLIDVFPTAQQGQVRSMLSESLRGVVSQRLVLGLDGKRVPAAEILIVTQAIGNIIREGKLFQIKSAMQTGRSLGMCSLDESLAELVRSGKIDPAVGKRIAENPDLIPGGVQAASAGPVGASAGDASASDKRSPFFSRSSGKR